MRVFIDTNLWAYRLDQREPAKSEHMHEWLANIVADHEVVISRSPLCCRPWLALKWWAPMPISAMGAGSPA
jgi:hypothetical protein